MPSNLLWFSFVYGLARFSYRQAISALFARLLTGLLECYNTLSSYLVGPVLAERERRRPQLCCGWHRPHDPRGHAEHTPKHPHCKLLRSGGLLLCLQNVLRIPMQWLVTWLYVQYAAWEAGLWDYAHHFCKTRSVAPIPCQVIVLCIYPSLL